MFVEIGWQRGVGVEEHPQPPASPPASRRAASPYLLCTSSLMLLSVMVCLLIRLHLILTIFDDVPQPYDRAIPSNLYVHDQACRVREFSQAFQVHAVIHKCAAALCQYEARRAQDLQMMRNRRLPNRKMLHDVAYANRIAIRREQIQNPDPRGISQRLEPSGIGSRAHRSQFRRRAGAATRVITSVGLSPARHQVTFLAR